MPKKLSLHSHNNRLWVRFVNMKSNSEFQQLLDCFKQEFAHAIWQHDEKAWELLMTDAPRLHWFVHRFFGYDAADLGDGFAE